MPLTSGELSLVRIVSEKTGQPSKISGKQVQVLRWIPVGSYEPEAGAGATLQLDAEKEDII